MAVLEPVLVIELDMVDDIIPDAIVDVVVPVLTGAAAPPVAPLLLAVEDDETAQEADVGKVTPSLSRGQVSAPKSRTRFLPIALKELRTQRKADLRI